MPLPSSMHLQAVDGAGAAGEAPKGSRRLSAYFPSRGVVAESPRRAAALKLALFAFFVVTRALHPLLIDASKVDGKILYAKNTPVVMNKCMTVLLMNTLAFCYGGLDGLRLCWQPRCLAVFGLIGAVYALGDFLEMQSMSKLSGGVYQVLLQTKLLITALMCWWLKGSRQSSLQWHVLFAMFLAMSAFVLVDMGSEGGGGVGALPLFGVVCVMLKVAVSCYCAVLSEKYLKAFSDMPLFAKISGLSTTWALASLMLCLADPRVAAEGFFAHWSPATGCVMASFVVKTCSTMYLLQALDSLQKNIGEALAVIVIYVAQVAMAGFNESFELSVFLLAVLVVALVKAYLISPKAASGKKDAPKRAAATKMQVVSLNSDSKQGVENGGVTTMVAEVHGVMPPGVFYGMLGGVYPVCGKPHSTSPRHLELAMLAHPTPGPDEHPAQAAARQHLSQPVGFMPEQSLTVLGQVRPHEPSAAADEASAARWVKDIEQARSHLLGGLAP